MLPPLIADELEGRLVRLSDRWRCARQGQPPPTSLTLGENGRGTVLPVLEAVSRGEGEMPTEATRLGLICCCVEGQGLPWWWWRRRRGRQWWTRLRVLLFGPPHRERRQVKKLHRVGVDPGRRNGECASRRGRGHEAREAPRKILEPAPWLISEARAGGGWGGWKGDCTRQLISRYKCRQGGSAIRSRPIP